MVFPRNLTNRFLKTDAQLREVISATHDMQFSSRNQFLTGLPLIVFKCCETNLQGIRDEQGKIPFSEATEEYLSIIMVIIRAIKDGVPIQIADYSVNSRELYYCLYGVTKNYNMLTCNPWNEAYPPDGLKALMPPAAPLRAFHHPTPLHNHQYFPTWPQQPIVPARHCPTTPANRNVLGIGFKNDFIRAKPGAPVRIANADGTPISFSNQPRAVVATMQPSPPTQTMGSSDNFAPPRAGGALRIKNPDGTPLTFAGAHVPAPAQNQPQPTQMVGSSNIFTPRGLGGCVSRQIPNRAPALAPAPTQRALTPEPAPLYTANTPLAHPRPRKPTSNILNSSDEETEKDESDTCEWQDIYQETIDRFTVRSVSTPTSAAAAPIRTPNPNSARQRQISFDQAIQATRSIWNSPTPRSFAPVHQTQSSFPPTRNPISSALLEDSPDDDFEDINREIRDRRNINNKIYESSITPFPTSEFEKKMERIRMEIRRLEAEREREELDRLASQPSGIPATSQIRSHLPTQNNQEQSLNNPLRPRYSSPPPRLSTPYREIRDRLVRHAYGFDEAEENMNMIPHYPNTNAMPSAPTPRYLAFTPDLEIQRRNTRPNSRLGDRNEDSIWGSALPPPPTSRNGGLGSTSSPWTSRPTNQETTDDPNSLYSASPRWERRFEPLALPSTPSAPIRMTDTDNHNALSSTTTTTPPTSSLARRSMHHSSIPPAAPSPTRRRPNSLLGTASNPWQHGLMNQDTAYGYGAGLQMSVNDNNNLGKRNDHEMQEPPMRYRY